MVVIGYLTAVLTVTAMYTNSDKANMSNLAKVWQKQLSYDSKTVQIFHKTEKLTDIFLSQTSFHVAKSVKYC